MRRPDKGSSGAVTAELVILLPVLVILLFGMINFALAWNYKNALDHAARDAARAGAVTSPYDPAVVSAVVDEALSGTRWTTANLDVVCAEKVDAGTPGTCPATSVDTTYPRVQVRLAVTDYRISMIFFELKIDSLEGWGVARYEGA